jgi:hypothetical protein
MDYSKFVTIAKSFNVAATFQDAINLGYRNEYKEDNEGKVLTKDGVVDSRSMSAIMKRSIYILPNGDKITLSSYIKGKFDVNLKDDTRFATFTRTYLQECFPMQKWEADVVAKNPAKASKDQVAYFDSLLPTIGE